MICGSLFQRFLLAQKFAQFNHKEINILARILKPFRYKIRAILIYFYWDANRIFSEDDT